MRLNLREQGWPSDGFPKGIPLAVVQEAREQAEHIERSNIGYYAGYYDSTTRERVERLFRCSHPIFGKVAERGTPTAEDAFETGRRLGAAGMATE